METIYKIIGGDGVEYGPASLAELESWIGDGRVAGSTQVWRSDLAHWSPAARYIELQQALARLHARTQTYVAQALRPAGFWPRVGAYLLDRVLLAGIFLFFMLGPLAHLLGWKMDDLANLTRQAMQGANPDFSTYAYQMYPFVLSLVVIYDTVMNGTFGATLGKMAIGARILAADGTRLGYTRAFFRSLAGRLTEVLLGWGYLSVAFRRDRRGMHDFIAGTKVVFDR